MTAPAGKRRRKVPRIVRRKLGREQAYGQCVHGERLEVDARLRRLRELNTVVHEALHWADPDMSETKVLRVASLVGRILWADGWRRVET
jgi:hypothetical protein